MSTTVEDIWSNKQEEMCFFLVSTVFLLLCWVFGRVSLLSVTCAAAVRPTCGTGSPASSKLSSVWLRAAVSMTTTPAQKNQMFLTLMFLVDLILSKLKYSHTSPDSPILSTQKQHVQHYKSFQITVNALQQQQTAVPRKTTKLAAKNKQPSLLLSGICVAAVYKFTLTLNKQLQVCVCCSAAE